MRTGVVSVADETCAILAFVLILIGGKIFVGDLFFDGKVPAEISLIVTFGLLFGGVVYSLWKSRDTEAPRQVYALQVSHKEARESAGFFFGAREFTHEHSRIE